MGREVVMFSLNNLQISQEQIYFSRIITLWGKDDAGRKYLVLKFSEELQGNSLAPVTAESKSWISSSNWFILGECSQDYIKSSDEFKGLLERNVIALVSEDGDLFGLNGFKYKINGNTTFTIFRKLKFKPTRFPISKRGKLSSTNSINIKKILSESAHLFDKNSTTSTNAIYRLPLKPLNSNPSPITARVTTTFTKISSSPTPPIPLHETYFDSLEKYNGNNFDKDKFVSHSKLLGQAIYLAKNMEYIDIEITNSFDFKENLNAVPYINQNTQATNISVKFNYYIKARNKSGNEINLILERELYSQKTDPSLALNEIAEYANSEQKQSLLSNVNT